ncbi:TetR/AcrR family transcriptional regulator [Sinorhizobium sp. BG8]|uniref:TetR/AcrR family transcriptional regulator n=1 Tax=Sinorhizobium sp. BG8 TaxID=2613773 RepID=UPI00193E456A|nr:TetR/AcrR family transcriptional regulator [Sinorhizobium sp. BG8]QRM56463.1 TetR/AcrR family transcriptional regulator [Sinorhizobium sp. BG8]
MTSAHHRKKQPELVRGQLLKVAARLMIEKGLPSVTLDAVSQSAGVSKGGLLHHFPNKVSLLDGLFESLVDNLDEAIEARMLIDPQPRGRFTRAYLAVCFVPGGMPEGEAWKSLTIALMGEPYLRERWRQWVAGRAAEHVGTDSSVNAELVRFAADGLWLAEAVESHAIEPDRQRELMDRLVELSML